MSVPAEHFEAFRETLEAYDFMRGIRLNVAVEHDDFSFLKLTIKVRHKIVADGLNDATFDVTNKGVHLNAREFNAILDDPNTIVVDFRNHYESEVGHFKGAITPDVETFRESLPIINEQLKDFKESKNLVMYCTGGIRCEKSTAYLKEQGFEEVYHLDGGILKYLEEMPEENSLWQGECFVFDQRVAVKHGLEQGSYDQCYACRMPLSRADMQSDKYIKGMSCPHCHDQLSDEQKASFAERQKQIELAKQRGEQHIRDGKVDF